MEQKPAAAKPKNKFLKFLPRASAVVSFQNPPLFSPSKDKIRSDHHNTRNHKTHGLSGPIVPLIPAEARRKSKNSSFAAQEPTSPKVSCMGQIKCKHMPKKKISNKQINKHVARNSSFPAVKNKTEPVPVPVPDSPALKRKKSFAIRKMFSGGRKSDASNDRSKPALISTDRAPSLSQMKRFASGRDSFANFDWTTQIAPVDSDGRDCYSDEEREGSGEEDEEVIIPFSAPILMMNNGGANRGLALEPRKEINLWKRRTMAQPKPLQLRTTMT